jgi:SAM-dependent methyltransferase
MLNLVVALKRRTPWWAKMGAKVVVARLPVGYRFWRAVSVSVHGEMQDPPWAYETFRRHYDAGDFARKGAGFKTLEIGPGDSLNTGLIAHALGGSETTLIDVAPFASLDLAVYRSMARFLGEQGLPVTGLDALGTTAEVLDACSTRYLTQGIESLRALPDASVDFAFTNAVLQSVRRVEVPEMLRELRRVLRPGGMSSHSIDLRDFLTSELNHLRFSESVWESHWLSRSGCYTNRLRLPEWRQRFEEAGFQVEFPEVNRWDRLPLSRSRMHPAFREFSDEDLRASTINVTLRPA